MNDFKTRDRLFDGNPTLTLMVGVARSGKSTLAKDMALNGRRTVVLRGDDVRRALGVQFEPILEPAVKMVRTYAPLALLHAGYDVISDETHLRRNLRASIIELARAAVPDVRIRVVEVEHPPIDEHRERCLRDDFPFEVVERMLEDFECVGPHEGHDEYVFRTQGDVRVLWRKVTT